MARAWLGILVLVATNACGRVELESPGPMTIGGADSSGELAGTSASGGGASASGGGASASGGGASGGGASGGGASGGLTGTGGLPQLQAALTECQRFCEGADYLLPGALCEDWNRPEWHPQFCRVGQATPWTSCADYCSQVYEAVTPECAARLQPAVQCVAPTYANSVSLPPPNGCWLSDCREQLFSMTSVCYGQQERLAAARVAWQASGVVAYQLTYDLSRNLKARVTVRPGSEPAVTPADAFAWTVPLLFDEVERLLHEPGVTPSVSYDAGLGYVADLAREQGCAAPSALVTGIEVAPSR